MKQTICHRQIRQSVNINLSIRIRWNVYIAIKPKVFLVVSGKSACNRMVVVDDRGHCIESEPINVIDLHEIQQLTQEELNDLELIPFEQM